MTQLKLTFDDLSQQTIEGEWLAFTLAQNVDVAKAKFAERYGVEPERVELVPNLLLIGPIPQKDEEAL